ncbi:nucleolar protein 12-like [Lutzomyia longipalpis]|uniref:nucleolar protein 12-like n=1 Tax=Lutzomyia longipalpis TaxID=7200 RepID=UPI00248358B4|nr:nucleolar protein 12-like [Lutzomyia longipalpis]
MGAKPKNKSGNGGKSRPKVVINFDEKKRREFLTGFRKRKLQRKERAKEEIEQRLKIEKKQLRDEIRSNITKQFKKSFQPIPELEEQEAAEEEEYETEDVTVKITELSTYDLAKENNWVGENKAKLEESFMKEEDSASDEDNEEEEIPGMSVKAPKATPVTQESAAEKEEVQLKSKKELNRMVQDHTLKFLKNSKAYKMKTQLQRSKNRKKSRRERVQKEKMQKKRNKKSGGKSQKRK